MTTTKGEEESTYTTKGHLGDFERELPEPSPHCQRDPEGLAVVPSAPGDYRNWMREGGPVLCSPQNGPTDGIRKKTTSSGVGWLEQVEKHSYSVDDDEMLACGEKENNHADAWWGNERKKEHGGFALDERVVNKERSFGTYPPVV